MPTINKIVDKTTVNGSEIFIYSFNVSFSGLSVPATNGKVVDFFPSKIRYQLPPIGGNLVSINQIPITGGTNVEFNFGSVTAGTSISFDMSCQFGPGREQNDSFTNVADLYADTLKVASKTAETVNLILNNSFELIKISNISGFVKPNQEITFQLILQNLNDPGYRINNIVLKDIIPAELTPVATFQPVGNDVSPDGYNDNTYNGKTGTFTGKTLDFSLPSYKGIRYIIIFKATVNNNVIPGQSITNTATWKVDKVTKPPSSTTFRVFEEKATTIVDKRGPIYAKIGGGIQYALSATNTGTLILNNYEIIDTPPVEVNLTKVAFNVSSSASPSFSIYVATSDNPVLYKAVAINVVAVNPVYDLTQFIPINQRITSIKATMVQLNPINSPATMSMYGTVNNIAVINSTIINKVIVTATSSLGNITANSSASTILNGKSVLNIKKYINPLLPAYYPLDEINMQMQSASQKGMVYNPIFSDLLPQGIEYVSNKEYYIYSDNLEGKSYDSRLPNFPVPLPIVEVIKNYLGTGRTLVRFHFKNFTILFTNNLLINFVAMVKINPPSIFTNNAFLGNPGSNTEVDGTSHLDIDDLDGDLITNEEIAKSNAVTGNILTTSAFSLEKFVKGNLDNDYSTSASATPGGDVTYKLNITNNQLVDLRDIEIVDILPHIGDTGVILNEIPRGSQYNIYATSTVFAEIINIIGNPVNPFPEIIIEYSTSVDPIRFNEEGNGTIGTGTWSITPPLDITTLRSIKVKTDTSVILKPYERLVVTIKALTPIGVSKNLLAYNSYAVKANRVDGDTVSNMAPTEPNKVSVQIKQSLKSSIGNLVWIDTNGNGLYEVGEVGINGINIELYDENMVLLKTTVTANNNLFNPGYYQFSELEPGKYFVKFIPGTIQLTTQQLVVNGSKPNPITKLTNLITLEKNENNTTIIAGVIEEICNPPIINASNKCLMINTPFYPMLGVTAFDCMGNDITKDIIITFNNVLPQTAGIYQVTYQVTDYKFQTTTLTINVRVCENGPRMQAINDIVESVALEQTALSHILNAEGEKLQYIINSKNPTPEQVLEFNHSVKKTINQITNLEIILYSKLELFKKIKDNNCCK